MSFFEPLPPSPASVARAAAVSPPAWVGPPLNVLPGVVPVELIVARTDETVVAVTGVWAYPTGFHFTLSLRLRHLSPRQQQQFPHLFEYGPPEGDPMPEDALRFGVLFADGGKATNLDRSPFTDDEGRPDPPVLSSSGGGGSPEVWGIEQWVWPLPPPGPFAFVCQWPGRGIPESRAEIDARLILEAAERAVTLWPDEDSSDRGWTALR
jgi:hypothetical protein